MIGTSALNFCPPGRFRKPGQLRPLRPFFFIECKAQTLDLYRVTNPPHKAPPPSTPALGYYAKGLPAAVVLLRRNRTDRPLQRGIFAPALTDTNATVKLASDPPPRLLATLHQPGE